MSLSEVTLKSGYDTLTSISIDGRAYDIHMKWNSRDESFGMRFGMQGGDFSCHTKVTVNSDLLGKVRHIDGMPQGILFVIDTIGSGDGRLSYSEFGSGKRFRLMYRGV